MKKNILFLLLIIVSVNKSQGQPTIACQQCQSAIMFNCSPAILTGACQSNTAVGCETTSFSYYYQSFNPLNASADFFNEPDANGCQAWSFLMAQNNCNDHCNFNYHWPANTHSVTPWSQTPRCSVVSGGRLSAADHCLKITCVPDDDVDVKANSLDTRSEILFRPELNDGDTYSYGFSFKLPPGFKDTVSSCLTYSHLFIAQWHAENNNGKILVFNYHPSGDPDIPDTLKIRYGLNGGGLIAKFRLDEDVWYDVVMNIKWSADASVGSAHSIVYQGCNIVVNSPIVKCQTMAVTDDSSLCKNIFQAGIYRGDAATCDQYLYFDEFALTNDPCCHPLPAPYDHCLHSVCCIDGRMGGNEINSNLVVNSFFSDNNISFKPENYSGASATLSLTVYDLYGRKIAAAKFNGSKEVSFSKSLFRTGVFVYTVADDLSENLYQGKFVIQ